MCGVRIQVSEEISYPVNPVNFVLHMIRNGKKCQKKLILIL